MAPGDVTISGGFTLDSTGRTRIDAFITSTLGAVSNGSIVPIYDINNSEVWIICRELQSQ